MFSAAFSYFKVRPFLFDNEAGIGPLNWLSAKFLKEIKPKIKIMFHINI